MLWPTLTLYISTLAEGTVTREERRRLPVALNGLGASFTSCYELRDSACVVFRAFFGSIPEDFGNRGESTITKLPMRNEQWQKHHEKDQTTANRMNDGVCVFFFFPK